MKPFRPSLFLTLLLCAPALWAQSSNVAKGRVFWLGFMQNYEGATQLKLYVSSNVATTGIASVPLDGWAQTFVVPANGVATIDVPLIYQSFASESLENMGILVATEDSCSVYALSFETATADASAILPFQSLGTEYRVQAYRGLMNYDYNSELLIVGAADSTEVEIVPACNTAGGHLAGVPFTVTVHAGKTYQVQADSGYMDLTGTTVRSTSTDGTCHPFAVFGGSVCPDVPDGCFACDHIFEQMIPLAAWGTRYFATPFSDQNVYTLRLLANTDNTTISVDGNALPLLNAGDHVELNGQSGAHCITGDQPFSVAQLMQGSDCSGGNSDPAMLLLNKDEEIATDVTFTTVVSSNMTEHWINVVTTPGNENTMQLDGTPVDPLLFTVFNGCTDRVWGALQLTEGSHTLTATAGFSAYAYGHGPNYESYAYALGTVSTNVSDSLICYAGGPLTLYAPSWITDPYWYDISSPQDTLALGSPYTFTPGFPISIGVSQIGTGNCIQGRRFHIGLIMPVTATLSAEPTEVCPGDSVQLSAVITPDTPNNAILWTPSYLVYDPLNDTTVATVMETTWFVAHITGDFGCSAFIDSVQVSAFTPVLPVITQTGNTLSTGAFTSYQWFLNELPIPGANGPTYEITGLGEYGVLVTDVNGCSGLSDTFVALYDGVSEFSASNILVTSDHGTLNVRTTDGADLVEVFDLLGQRVVITRDHARSVRLNVNSEGVYLVRITKDGTSVTQRVVVLR